MKMNLVLLRNKNYAYLEYDYAYSPLITGVFYSFYNKYKLILKKIQNQILSQEQKIQV